MADQDDNKWGGFKAPTGRETLNTGPRVPPVGQPPTEPPQYPTEPRPPPTGPMPPSGGPGPSSSGNSNSGAAGSVPNNHSDPIPGAPGAQVTGSATGLPQYPRSGNFIFTVGKVRCGKTTLQSHLLRYLMQSGEHSLTLNPEFARLTAQFERLLSQWQKAWETGRFPMPNQANRPSEFRYHVEAMQPGKPPLDFGFIEISGEDFNDLTAAADEGRHANLDPGLNAFLANPNVNLVFMLVANGENVSEDDKLFRLFLQYLEQERFKDRNFRENCSAILVIANPEVAVLRLQEALKHKIAKGEIEPGDLDTVMFARTFVPYTTSQLQSWDPQKRGIILPFSVGRLRYIQESGRTTPVIEEVDFKHARALYHWLYHRFTGNRLGPNMVQRYWKSFLNTLNKLGPEN